MADPDKEPKEKSVHAQKLTAERAIMEMTGANRSQIRHAALGTPLREFITRFQGGGGVVAQPQAQPVPPKIETEDQSFQAKPLTLGVREGGQGGAPAALPNARFRVIVEQPDGTFLLKTFNGSGNLT